VRRLTTGRHARDGQRFQPAALLEIVRLSNGENALDNIDSGCAR